MAGVQSIDRTFDILETLAGADQDLGAAELAKELGLPYATVHRLVATLLARGYVQRNPRTRRYLLGPRLAALGASAGRSGRSWIQPHLEALVQRVGETANLAILQDGYIEYVAQASAERIVRMFTEVGNRVLPHSTAVGKAVLAQQKPALVAEILARHGMPAATPHTITDADTFMEELEMVRRQGYAVDLEEQEEGVCCVAVPVMLAHGWTAGLSVSGPAGRLSAARRERIVEEMKQTAREVEESLPPSVTDPQP